MPEPTDKLCPRCSTPLEPYMEADIGVGIQTFGPWGCPACHWVEPTEDYGIKADNEESDERLE